MKARDRVAIGGMLVLLVVIGAALLMPGSSKPAAASSPTPALSETPYREAILGHPSSINPLTPRSQADRDLIALLFRGLVREGPDGALLPDLATGWSVSDEGRTYTFQMRDDAFWEDGFHVTAADVVFTVGLLQDSRYTGPAGASWQGVHATATGVYTVQMTMSLANAGFLRLASQPIVPQHLLKDTPVTALADSPYSAKPIGDGPFRILKLSYSQAVLQRVGTVNPATTAGPTVSAPPSSAASGSAPASGSAGASAAASPSVATATPTKTAPAKASGSASPSATIPPTAAPTPSPTAAPTPTPKPTATPYIDLSGKTLTQIGTMELDFYDDPAVAVADFKAGKLDALGGMPADQTAAAATTPGARVIPYQWASMVSVVVNQRPEHQEMRDTNARTGLLAAIDRQKLLATVFGGRGSLSDLPLPSWSPYYELAATAPVPFSPTDAASFLNDAGWTLAGGQWAAPEASPSTSYALELLTPSKSANPLLYSTAQFVADSWKAIGLNVMLDDVPITTYLSRLDQGDFTAAVVSFDVGLEPDLSPLLLSSQIGSGGSNVSGVQDPTLDQLLLTARKTVDPAARPAALTALEQYLSTTVPILPLAYREYDMVVSGHVQKLLSNQISDPSSRYWDVIDWRLASDR
jgi:ABC-type transport system substrate-binding protein